MGQPYPQGLLTEVRMCVELWHGRRMYVTDLSGTYLVAIDVLTVCGSGIQTYWSTKM